MSEGGGIYSFIFGDEYKFDLFIHHVVVYVDYMACHDSGYLVLDYLQI